RLKGPEVGAATLGDRLVLALPLPEPLPEKPELRYYAVRTSGPHGDRSEYSNQAILVPRTPPPPPAETQVKPRGAGAEGGGTPPADGAGAPGDPGDPRLRRLSARLPGQGFRPAAPRRGRRGSGLRRHHRPLRPELHLRRDRGSLARPVDRERDQERGRDQVRGPLPAAR